MENILFHFKYRKKTSLIKCRFLDAILKCAYCRSIYFIGSLEVNL